ncbi:MAG: TIGR04372 family glycosyltransferase [SAR202 cluster bacterium]|nr:TIGR04372 family glycosyltransferase [SAR202 cluster bacterium]
MLYPNPSNLRKSFIGDFKKFVHDRIYHPHQIRFWRQQVYKIKNGGLLVLLQKCLFALRLASAIPIVLLLRALRPLVLVRFGVLISHHIGHFSSNTELYLCERDAGLQPKRTIDIFHQSYRISNQQLKTMWERTLRVSPLVKWLYLANNLLPGGTAHVVPLLTDIDFQGALPLARVHLFFTPEEEVLGQAGLRDLGLPEGAPFVCVYGRDTAYKGRLFPNQDDRRNDYRNMSIQNFVPAAEELARRGYFVIRMGAEVNEALRTTNPMIIDYATKARDDFLDIFLCAKCRFFMGGTGGLNSVPRLFHRPVVIENLVPFLTDQPLRLPPKCLILPKKLWLLEDQRFMTFREFLETGPDFLELGPIKFPGFIHFERIGVEVVENTPEEIIAVAMEMDERLNGTWQITDEDRELQQRFWSILEVTGPNEDFRPRMGAEFLRQNRELLD